MSAAVVSGLHIYPIKSCRGLALDNVLLTETGFASDRRWMLVNEQGRFVTQRERPKLALVAPELHGAGLRVRAPDTSLLEISGIDGAPVNVQVWKDMCPAFDEGHEASQWFSNFLGTAVRLVRFNETFTRLSNRDWTGELAAMNLFSDGFPILVISEASLADLNARLPEALPMNRFRPNLVISGVDAYAEDGMVELSAGPIALRIVKPCTRCKITTTDQATGLVTSREPLATLMGYRRNRQLQGVTFGQNVIIRSGLGERLHVGQALQISLPASPRDH